MSKKSTLLLVKPGTSDFAGMVRSSCRMFKGSKEISPSKSFAKPWWGSQQSKSDSPHTAGPSTIKTAPLQKKKSRHTESHEISANNI